MTANNFPKVCVENDVEKLDNLQDNCNIEFNAELAAVYSQTVFIPLPKFAPHFNKPFYENFETLLYDPHSSNNKFNHNGNPNKDYSNMITLDSTYDQERPSKISLKEKLCESFEDITNTSKLPNVDQLADSIENNSIDPKQLYETLLSDPHSSNKIVNHNGNPNKDISNMVTLDSTYHQERPSEISLKEKSCESFEDITKTSENLGQLPSLYQLRSLGQLADNIENKPIDPKQCTLCGKILSTNYSLKMHYRTHIDVRYFKCKHCGSHFQHNANLKRHLSNRYNKTHQCSICNKLFCYSATLQQHIQSHTEKASLKLTQLCKSINDKPLPLPRNKICRSQVETKNKSVFETFQIGTNLQIKDNDSACIEKLDHTYTSVKNNADNESKIINKSFNRVYSKSYFSNTDNENKNTPKISDKSFGTITPNDNAIIIRSAKDKALSINLNSGYHHPFTNENDTNPHNSLNVSDFTNYSMSVSENKVKRVISNAITHPFTADWELRQNAASGFREINQMQLLESNSQNISTTPTYEPYFDVTSNNRFIAEPESLISRRESSDISVNIQTDPKQVHLHTAETFKSRRSHQLDGNTERNHIKLNQCTICEKILSSKGTLNLHYLTHTAELSFKCKVCERRFKRKAYLKRHLLRHRKRVRHTYKCSACPRVYHSSAAFQRHIQYHKESHGEFKVTPPQTTHLCKSIEKSPSLPDNEIHRSNAETTQPAIQTLGLNNSLSQNSCISSLNSAHNSSSLFSVKNYLSTERHPAILDISEPGQDNLVEENIDHSNSANSIGTIDNDSAIIENPEMMEAIGLQVLEILNKTF